MDQVAQHGCFVLSVKNKYDKKTITLIYFTQPIKLYLISFI